MFREREEEGKDRSIQRAEPRSLGSRTHGFTASRMLGLAIADVKKCALPPAPYNGCLTPSTWAESSWLCLLSAYLALARGRPAAALLRPANITMLAINATCRNKLELEHPNPREVSSLQINTVLLTKILAYFFTGKAGRMKIFLLDGNYRIRGLGSQKTKIFARAKFWFESAPFFQDLQLFPACLGKLFEEPFLKWYRTRKTFLLQRALNTNLLLAHCGKRRLIMVPFHKDVFSLSFLNLIL